MDTMTVNQGFALNESITIRDSSDSVITTYLGTETLSGMVRAGRAMPSVLTFTPTWNRTPATDGIVNFALTSTQTLTLSPGQVSWLFGSATPMVISARSEDAIRSASCPNHMARRSCFSFTASSWDRPMK